MITTHTHRLAYVVCNTQIQTDTDTAYTMCARMSPTSIYLRLLVCPHCSIIFTNRERNLLSILSYSFLYASLYVRKWRPKFRAFTLSSPFEISKPKYSNNDNQRIRLIINTGCLYKFFVWTNVCQCQRQRLLLLDAWFSESKSENYIETHAGAQG